MGGQGTAGSGEFYLSDLILGRWDQGAGPLPRPQADRLDTEFYAAVLLRTEESSAVSRLVSSS